MKHKICYSLFLPLILAQVLTACDVKLQDKGAFKERLEDPLEEQRKRGSPLEISGDPFVIDGPLVLANHENIEVDRLHLTKNAVITTEDKNLVIVANEITSDGALIRNFPEDQRAFWEKSGRSGGNIIITVKKAVGTLQVHLQGEGGGSGKHGINRHIEGHPGCAGTSGGNGGNAGSLRAEINDGLNFNLSFQNKEGAPGPAGIRGSTHAEDPHAAKVSCYRDLPNGIDGKPGEKGQVCLKPGNEENFRCQ